MAATLIRIGALATDDPTIIKTFGAQASAASRYDRFQAPIGTAYQVTAGKTLHIVKLVFFNNTIGTYIQISYGDNAISDAVTVPTNNKFITQLLANPGANLPQQLDVDLQIPASKYPHLYAAGAFGVVQAWGFEI